MSSRPRNTRETWVHSKHHTITPSGISARPSSAESRSYPNDLGSSSNHMRTGSKLSPSPSSKSLSLEPLGIPHYDDWINNGLNPTWEPYISTMPSMTNSLPVTGETRGSLPLLPTYLNPPLDPGSLTLLSPTTSPILPSATGVSPLIKDLNIDDSVLSPSDSQWERVGEVLPHHVEQDVLIDPLSDAQARPSYLDNLKSLQQPLLPGYEWQDESNVMREYDESLFSELGALPPFGPSRSALWAISGVPSLSAGGVYDTWYSSPSSSASPSTNKGSSTSSEGTGSGDGKTYSWMSVANDGMERKAGGRTFEEILASVQSKRRRITGHHTCEICHDQFTSRQNLKNHMNSHYRISPYVCSECRKTFGHSRSLNRHRKKGHGFLPGDQTS